MDNHLSRNIIQSLSKLESESETRKITVGFDGYIDHLYKVVKKRQSSGSFTEFKTIQEFSNNIQRASDKSADIEIIKLQKKIGGNAPIMANAISCAGLHVNCIGMLGYPDIDPVFKELSATCKLYSFLDPAYTYALEFTDGKLMFADLGNANSVKWEVVTERISKDQIYRLYDESDLVAFVNWSGITGMDNIWHGIKNDILPNIKREKKLKVFFDLSDPSRRTSHDLLFILKLITQYSHHYSVTLGLNENEARKVFTVLMDKSDEVGEFKDYPIEYIGRYIYGVTYVDYIVIHLKDKCLCVTNNDIEEQQSKFIKEPAILTGAGDNFNAGFCIGWLVDLKPVECMILASALSYYYVKYGKSPTIKAITDTINNDF